VSAREERKARRAKASSNNSNRPVKQPRFRMGQKEHKESKKPPKRKRKRRTRRKKRIYLLPPLTWKPLSSSLPPNQLKCLKFRRNQRMRKRARLMKTLKLRMPLNLTSAQQSLSLLILPQATKSSQKPRKVKHRVLNRVYRDLSQM
jgi:hypothetical protein